MGRPDDESSGESIGHEVPRARGIPRAAGVHDLFDEVSGLREPETLWRVVRGIGSLRAVEALDKLPPGGHLVRGGDDQDRAVVSVGEEFPRTLPHRILGSTLVRAVRAKLRAIPARCS